MDIAVIGSYAAELNGLYLGHKADIDILCKYDDLKPIINRLSSTCKIVQQYPIEYGLAVLAKNKDGHIFEFSIAWKDSMAEKLLNFIRNSGDWYSGDMCGVDVMIPSLNILYMLKMSHRYKKNSPHFLKTMQDIKKFREYGCTIPPEYLEFFKQREKDTYTYAHPNLNVNKDKFFSGDNVQYEYDHDSIHDAVKHLNRPAYTYFLQGEVKVSKEKWDNLGEFVKICSVTEEAYVLALERSQIPYPNADRKQSFLIALEKICTSISSGWWREFAWENYEKVIEMYNDNYVDKFKLALSAGAVKPFR